MVKNLPANAGDLRDAGSILGLGRSPGGGHGNPLQYSLGFQVALVVKNLSVNAGDLRDANSIPGGEDPLE